MSANKAATRPPIRLHFRSILDCGRVSLSEVGLCEVRKPQVMRHPQTRGKRYPVSCQGLNKNPLIPLGTPGPLYGLSATPQRGSSFEFITRFAFIARWGKGQTNSIEELAENLAGRAHLAAENSLP